MTMQLTEAETRNDSRKRGFIADHHLEHYERWLDSKFRLPGTDFTFGLDGVIGLVPVVGDLATSGVSALFVLDGWRGGIRKRAIAKMIGNIGLDLTLGSVPVVGDLFDFAFKSNVKNLRILKAERALLDAAS